MANTAFAKADNLTVKRWATILYKEALEDIYLSKFMGTDSNAIIQVREDLTKQKGDKITIPLRMQLSGAGQSSQTYITLEGNEESLTFYDFGVELSIYGHAVRADGKLSLKRPAFDLRQEMKNALKDWLTNKIEDLIINALVTNPTSGRTLDKTSGNMTVDIIQEAKRKAMLVSPKIRPVKVNGNEYYIMLVHPYVAKAIKADTDWKNAQLYANIRGERNPIFTGALGVIDGVVLHEYSRPELLCDTDTAHYAYSLLLGAQAGVVAWGQRPSWYEKLFDYNRVPGVATDFIAGVAKTVFNSEDFGVITVKTGYTPDS